MAANGGQRTREYCQTGDRRPIDVRSASLHAGAIPHWMCTCTASVTLLAL